MFGNAGEYRLLIETLNGVSEILLLLSNHNCHKCRSVPSCEKGGSFLVSLLSAYTSVVWGQDSNITASSLFSLPALTAASQWANILGWAFRLVTSFVGELRWLLATRLNGSERVVFFFNGKPRLSLTRPVH